MQFIDTHCHIHDSEFQAKYDQSVDDILTDARSAGVDTIICVGTDVQSSREAVEFASSNSECYSSIGIHPHEAATMDENDIVNAIIQLESMLGNDKVKALGECGLDYYYHDDEAVRNRQQHLLRNQLDLAKKSALPVIYHVRDQKERKNGEKTAFDDLFKLLDDYKGVTGVIHSFSADPGVLERVINRGLYVGLNGIMTFSKDQKQLQAAKQVPKERLLLETDAPFLTPKPFRGKMCKPEHIVLTAKFLATLRGESLTQLADMSSTNAKRLFNL